MKLKCILLFAFCLSLFHNNILHAQMAEIITTIAGNSTGGFGGDGGPATASTCELYGPGAMARDAAGNIYVVDGANNRIRKISTAGTITTIAGTGAASDAGDGTPAVTAPLFGPSAIAVDAAGNIYVTTNSHTVRKITAGTGIISLFAGSYGFWGYTGDGGPATTAELHSPQGLAVDAAGNVLISDTWNSVIRKVDGSGHINTVYGDPAIPGGYGGDGGPASAAQMLGPKGLCFDAAGNLFVADASDCVIRKINTLGYISTVAGYYIGGIGSGGGGYGGDGGLATAPACLMNQPTAVAVDASSNLYIVDYLNFIVRKVDPSGVITTYAGEPTIPSYTGDGGPATGATLNYPWGIVLDASGNVLIGDANNNVVRKVALGTLTPVSISGDTVMCYMATNTLTGAPAGGSWYSSDAFVANVDLTSGAVYGESVGTATISYFSGSMYATVTVDVIDCSSTITISGDTSICAGASSTLTPSLGGGTWSSTDPSVATVGLSSGILTGVSAGTAIINYITSTGLASVTAIVNNCSSTISITGATTICQHTNSTLTPSVSGGTWSSSNTLVATVNPSSGLVRGITTGTSVIKYKTTADSATVVVTIIACPLYSTNTPAVGNGLKVYPNPNNGTCSMLVSTPAQERAAATLTNIVGENLKDFTILTNTPIDLDIQQPTGIYFLSVAASTGRYVAKVVVE